ncbi:MAG: VOC family protein [Turicibacter sp.]
MFNIYRERDNKLKDHVWHKLGIMNNGECFGGLDTMISEIGKVTLYVNNQQEAKDFWLKKMHFVLKVDQPMGPNEKWMEVSPSESSCTCFVLSDKEKMLSQNPLAEVGHPSLLLTTKDIVATHEQMKHNEVEVGDIINMPFGKMFSFKDQDGQDFMIREG